MAPSKLGSLRRRRSATHRLTPFRDDTGLVALRYEQTKQAEPPIPIPPPKDPRRAARSSSVTNTNATTNSSSAAQTQSSIQTSTPTSTSNLVTIGPPRALLLQLASSPPIPPPQEEHPLFRNQRRENPQTDYDARKRDSGAPTASTATLREEGVEDLVRLKILDDINDSPVASPGFEKGEQPQQQQQQQQQQQRPQRPQQKPPAIKTRPPVVEDQPLASPTPKSPTVSAHPPSSPVKDVQAAHTNNARPESPEGSAPTRKTSLVRKISVSLGMGSGSGAGAGAGTGAGGSASFSTPPKASTHRLRKKSKPHQPQLQHQDPNLNAADRAAPSPVQGRVSGPFPSQSPHSPIPLTPPSPQKETGASCSAAASAAPIPTLAPASSSPTATTAGDGASMSFAPITTPIPDDRLWEDVGNVSFSHRGSIMLLGGKKRSKPAHDNNDTTNDVHPQDSSSSGAVAMATQSSDPEPATVAPQNDGPAETPTPVPVQADAPSVPSIRVSSMDVERESQKVRSLYESGDDLSWEDGARLSFAERLEPTAEVPSDEEESCLSSRPSARPSGSGETRGPGDSLHPNLPATTLTPRSAHSLSPRRDSQIRREHEAAGGIEDWSDLDGVEVDRYGFITPKRPASRSGSMTARPSPLASSVRKRNVLTKRPSTSHSTSLPGGFMRPPSRKVSARSLNTYASELSSVSRRSTRSSIRSATNRLPHNRERRWMDEASEMLSLQAGLTGISDDDKMGKLLEAQKRKEAERSEKWRKMAIPVNKAILLPPGSSSSAPATTSVNGRHTSTSSISSSTATQQHQPQQPGVVSPLEGMSYTFDTTSPKLIERTWKGIPDCWRSAAWYSFLSASARAHGSRETEDYLISEFHRLQNVASPDDVQIDLDVPRTVSGHIMFRRRYRGGQRLLFRVLHAISLYFPATGYVQGMASLAATLLCYFDEERAFVMMVRLWRYRGLETLYQPGFAGLMGALNEFEKHWLSGAGRDVAAKLNELAIDATAYGTRWYLTLFNLSIPFPAQLRVWDVFMLLGDCPPESSSSDHPDPSSSSKPDDDALGVPPPPPRGLDVLHATATALIHALRDVLLDSDFENAMKALTAWIPVRDEDLLMKVARAEWKRHQHQREQQQQGDKKGEHKEKRGMMGIGRLREKYGRDGKDNNHNTNKEKGKEKSGVKMQRVASV